MTPVSSSFSPVNPTEDLVRQTAIRRQLICELYTLREAISSSGFSDDMTRQLDEWHTNFSNALRSYSDERQVLSAYIGLLQNILRDPVTLAPLDKQAVLGSDGYTYGSLSLAVYKLGTSEEYRKRSPMNPNNPESLCTRPHPVVRSMLDWVEGHDALLYSKELEERYLQLIPQKHESTAERIEKYRAKKAEKDRIDELARRKQAVDISAEMESQSKAFADKVSMSIESLAPTRTLSGRAQKILNEMKARRHAELSAMSVEVNAIAERDRIAIETSSKDIEDLRSSMYIQTEEACSLLLKRIETFEIVTSAEILAQKNTEALERLRSSVSQLESLTTTLTTVFNELKNSQSQLDRSIDMTKRELNSLRQEIIEAEKVIKEKQKGCMRSVMGTLAIIGTCVFAPYVSHAIAASLEGFEMTAIAARGTIAGGCFVAIVSAE